MKIDNQLIKYIEDLSALNFSQEEEERIKKDLSEIINFMEVLDRLDVTGVEELSHPFDYQNVFREDVEESSFDQEKILQNASDKTEEYFKSPPTY